jgi:hypothetical protein
MQLVACAELWGRIGNMVRITTAARRFLIGAGSHSSRLRAASRASDEAVGESPLLQEGSSSAPAAAASRASDEAVGVDGAPARGAPRR